MESVRTSMRRASRKSQVRVLTYSRENWDFETYEVFGEGRDPNPCPQCERIGFYGPRIEEPGRRYRQCRFCGFTQDIDQEPEQYRPTVHDCSDWPEVARAPYIWWASRSVSTFRCPFCRQRGVVSRSLVARPIDQHDHNWWKVPQGRKRSYYLRFWENWEFTKGRVFL